jgi:hypothetical protein
VREVRDPENGATAGFFEQRDSRAIGGRFS